MASKHAQRTLGIALAMPVMLCLCVASPSRAMATEVTPSAGSESGTGAISVSVIQTEWPEPQGTEQPQGLPTDAATDAPSTPATQDNLTQPYDPESNTSTRQNPAWELIQTGDFNRGLVASVLVVVAMVLVLLFWKKARQEQD